MITHQNQRFEYIENGITAYLSYTIDTQNIHDFDHTLVPPELGGHGIGKMLAQHALDFARKNGGIKIFSENLAFTWLLTQERL